MKKRKDRRKRYLLGRNAIGFLGALAMAGALMLGGWVPVMAGPVSVKSGIPETLDLNVQKMCPGIKGLPRDRKQVRAFSHRAHALEYLKGNEQYSTRPYTDEFTCSACHEGASSIAGIEGVPACEQLEKELMKAGSIKNPSKYFHKTCKSCHKKMKKAGKTTGPVSCKGCHGR